MPFLELLGARNQTAFSLILPGNVLRMSLTMISLLFCIILYCAALVRPFVVNGRIIDNLRQLDRDGRAPVGSSLL